MEGDPGAAEQWPAARALGVVTAGASTGAGHRPAAESLTVATGGAAQGISTTPLAPFEELPEASPVTEAALAAALAAAP